MLLRAMIVLLVAINLGVAAWWVLRTPTPAIAPVELPIGAARLQLLHEAPQPARAPEPAIAVQCHSFGPFTTPAALQQARAQLEAQGLRLRVRAQPAAESWRVYLPPLPSAQEAQAVAQQLAAVGIQDVVVETEGDARHGVALGRYRSRDLAQRRQAALRAAGFAAQLAADDAGPWWLDVAASRAFDAVQSARALAAPQSIPVDCTAISAADAQR